ncbi:NAD(P)-binding domain-containing protein [Streptomyces pilosus]|uniref:Monooxygenase n=1 Tax=Streptomyces pilosus TaxID=28893 RepID=A0A918F7P2_9ACTN|nr:NAD(P)-binding domain-containing protein [Streptomyces pilosus]GGR09098.1 monooxygenase [Streptomyces pilosus]
MKRTGDRVLAAVLRQPHAVLARPVQCPARDAVPRRPDRYPHRDEAVTYLTTYADRLDADIRTGRRVTAARQVPGGCEVETGGGERPRARSLVAASGSFGRPHCPALSNLDVFSGRLLYAADCRNPAPFTGQRVVVVGAGNSAVQIAAEPVEVASVTPATRELVKFTRRHTFGRDLHFWLSVTGLDTAPLGRVPRRPPTQPVLDDGRYRAALRSGRPDRRPLFTGVGGAKVTWPTGDREEVDAIVPATGYRPDLPYLAHLDGALDAEGKPLHREGPAIKVPGPAFVGLEWQRGLSSNSLRGVGRDAERSARRLAAPLTRR